MGNNTRSITFKYIQMETLKYTVIKNRTQYDQYCNQLEELVMTGAKNKSFQDEIDLLTLLIEKWDEEHNSFQRVDPIRLLKSLMAEHNLKSKDLVSLLGVSKGYVSEIMNYKKGLSKEVIRKLSAKFKVSQEAFNRAYNLSSSDKTAPGRTAKSKAGKKLAMV